MKIAVIVASVLFVVHMLYLLISYLMCDKSFNQKVWLRGGRFANDIHTEKQFSLLGDMEIMNQTYKPSAHTQTRNGKQGYGSGAFIRLQHVSTGECYDAYLEEKVQIGRLGSGNAEADILLNDKVVSGRHCILYRKGDQILVQDLGSSNHTYVNGNRVEGALPICHGDQLRFGNSPYQFQCYYQR